jgi:hypothetical protein
MHNFKEKKLPKILRYDHVDAWQFEPGEEIVVTHKIDGSMLSMRYSLEEDRVVCWSKNRELPANDKDFATGILYAQKFAEKIKLHDYLHLQFFGEYLKSGQIQKLYTKKDVVIIFGIYNHDTQSWLQWDDLVRVCGDIGIEHAWCIYKGQFSGWDSIKPFVGMSNLTKDGKGGEGIVIATDPSDGSVTRVKWVAETFKEHRKVKDKKQRKELTPSQLFIMENVNFNRVFKQVHYLLDHEAIDEADLAFSNFGSVAHRVNEAVFADILAEEAQPDDFDINEAIKTVNKQVPPHLRKIIQDKESV